MTADGERGPHLLEASLDVARHAILCHPHPPRSSQPRMSQAGAAVEAGGVRALHLGERQVQSKGRHVRDDLLRPRPHPHFLAVVGMMHVRGSGRGHVACAWEACKAQMATQRRVGRKLGAGARQNGGLDETQRGLGQDAKGVWRTCMVRSEARWSTSSAGSYSPMFFMMPLYVGV